MSSVNKVLLIGHVGQDPKIRTAHASGKKMAFLSLATSKRWKDREGNRKESTQWHQICVFGEQQVEEVERTITKGTQILVEGELQYRKYQGSDYVDRVAAEIVLQGFGSRIEAITGNAAEGGGGSRPPPPDGPESYGTREQQPRPKPQSQPENDEVPF